MIAFEGLLVDYAYEQEIHVIVKGVRNANDFDYENILHLVGESQEGRLRERGFNRRQIVRRLASQNSETEKRSKIQCRIGAENHGRMWILDNSDMGVPVIEQSEHAVPTLLDLS